MTRSRDLANLADGTEFTAADHTKLDGIATSANNYVHPNHSGEVTSTADGATVIVDDIVDEANLKVSNTPTNGYFLSAQSGNTGGMTWAEVAQPSASDTLNTIKTVDGTGSGLDADLLDGQHGAYYAPIGSPTLTGTPAAPTASAGANSTQISTTAYVDAAISALADSAPAALNTLNELAAALGDDANYAATTTTAIGTKLAKAGGQMTGNITMAGSQTVDGRDLSVDGTKLDTIETSATADQTDAEIRAAVEAASDSNVFTDADHSKLNGIETSATADQTAAQILTAIKTVDGSGSGLNADQVDGVDASSFLRSDASDSASGSYSFTNPYNEFGNSTGSVSNDGGWNARLNVAGASHARLDVTNVSDGIITSLYSHTGQGAGRVGTMSNHPLILQVNGNEKARLDANGQFSSTALVVSGDSNLHGGGTHLGNHEFAATDTGTAYSTSSIELRESNYTGTNSATPPRIGFHWGGVVASSIAIESSGLIAIRNNPGTSYENFKAQDITSTRTIYTASIDFNAAGPKLSEERDQNMKIKGHSGTDVGISGYDSSNNWRFQLYGSDSNYGFLDANWASWDIQKTVNGNLYLNGNNSYYLNPPSATVLNTLTVASDATFNGGAGAVTIGSAGDIRSSSNTWSGESHGKMQYHSNNWYMQYYSNVIHRNSGGSDKMVLDSNGNVTFSGNVTAYSDIRLKENIRSIENAVDLVGQMRGVFYTEKETKEARVGVIAQELEKVLPEVVRDNEQYNPETGKTSDPIKSVNYGNIVGVLIEAIKELKAEVEELKNGSS